MSGEAVNIIRRSECQLMCIRTWIFGCGFSAGCGLGGVGGDWGFSELETEWSLRDISRDSISCTSGALWPLYSSSLLLRNGPAEKGVAGLGLRYMGGFCHNGCRGGLYSAKFGVDCHMSSADANAGERRFGIDA